MSVIWKTLSQSVLASTAVSIYAPEASRQGAVHSASAFNPTGAAVVLNLYLVPQTGAADDTTKIASVSIPAGKAIIVPDAINVKIANPAQLYADGDGLTLTLTGAEADVV